ncbi:MAG: hypothetical protein AAGF95_27130 [Chloroflexota bacterium]
MSNVTVLTAETTDILQRLTLFITTEQGAQAVTALNSHMEQPRYQLGFTCVLEQDGVLVGYALLRHVRWHFGVVSLDVGMIEVLYINPVHYSQHLLEALLYGLFRVCYDNAIPLVTIQGNSALLESLGFAPYRLSALAWIDVTQQTEPKSVHQLQVYSIDRLDECAALYESNYRTSALTEIRVAADWRMWGEAESHIHVLEDTQGRTLAYAVQQIQSSSGELQIVEAAAADVGVATSLIDHLQQYAHTHTATRIACALPLAHPVTQAVLHRGGTTHIHTQLQPNGATTTLVDLAGVIDLSMALRALQTELEHRLSMSHYATWNGSIQVVLARQQITLAVANGQITIAEEIAPAQIWVHLRSLAATAQLLLGYRTSADLRANGMLQCTDTALGLLDILFPAVISYGLPTDWLVNQNM